MPRLLLCLVSILLVPTWTSPVAAAPTPAQLCESAIELASAKYAQCRLTAQSKNAKAPNPSKLTDALGKCSQKLSGAFAKATLRYGAACAATEPSSAFDEYLKQCSDDTTAAAGGAALPDYVGDLASCSADLSTCDGDLSTCTGDLATTTSELTTCEGDLAACAALPPARLLKTGQTTSYGAGSDGDLQIGITQNFIDNGDGTITDTKTGLMWEKKSWDFTIHGWGNQYTWSASGTQADGTVFTVFLATLNAGAGFAGYTDWRLPNRFELESIVNLGRVGLAINSIFYESCSSSGCDGTAATCSCSDSGYHWTSSTDASDASYAWYVYAYNGTNGKAAKGEGHVVRAVRGGS